MSIHSHYPLTSEQIEFFRTNGFIKLKQVLDAETLCRYGAEISKQVRLVNKETFASEDASIYARAFIQVGNIWEISPLVKEFVLGQRLARIAAELMEVTGVRLYHDQALYKQAKGGITPWHADQYYWPLASDKAITAWIPLHAIPREQGPLEFCPGSQKVKAGRDLGIGEESERKIGEVLRNSEKVDTPYDLGEVSFHGGWTFHRAGANTTETPREVMTIIYIDEAMRLAEPKKGQVGDRERWCPGIEVGAVIDSPLNPIIWSQNR